MIPARLVKYVSITPPAAIVDNATVTTTEIDTNGYNHMSVVVYLGATDIAMTSLSVTESDTTGSGHAAITGLIWGTSNNIDGSASALPTALDDNTFQIADIDLRGRKRFIDVTAVAGNGTAGTFITILGILSRASQSPRTVADVGANEVLRA